MSGSNSQSDIPPAAVIALCEELGAEAIPLSDVLWDIVGVDGHNYGAVDAEGNVIASVDPEHEYGTGSYMEGNY